MRSRVDKLGVASPEIRKQGTNQIVIQLAGVHDPAQAAAIIGTTAQLELYDLEVALVPPSITASGSQPVAFRNLYDLLSRVESTAKVGTPTGYVLFKPRQGQDDGGHPEEQEDEDDNRLGEEGRADRDPAPRSRDRERGSPGRVQGQDPGRLEGAGGAGAHGRDHVLAAGLRRLPGRHPGRAARRA